MATASWGQASALVPICCLERAQLGSEANTLEGGFQSGAFQHQCPHSRTSFTRMTATSVCIPRMSSICLLPLPEALKDWQVGLTQVHFKLLMHSWIPKQVRFVYTLQEWSLLLSAPWDSQSMPLLAFKAKHSGGLCSCCRIPGAGELDVGLRSLALWRGLLQQNFSVCGSPI